MSNFDDIIKGVFPNKENPEMNNLVKVQEVFNKLYDKIIDPRNYSDLEEYSEACYNLALIFDVLENH